MITLEYVNDSWSAFFFFGKIEIFICIFATLTLDLLKREESIHCREAILVHVLFMSDRLQEHYSDELIHVDFCSDNNASIPAFSTFLCLTVIPALAK